MPRISSAEDAAKLCIRIADYWQRRLNRALGVGKRTHTFDESQLHAAMVYRIKRDTASILARRIRLGIKRAERRKR